MAELYENKEAARERVILIGVCTRENENVEESLDELKELADTAGAEAVGRVIQNRESMHPGTYIGSGKIDEVRELAAELHADGVICDDELTPAQLRGLEQELVYQELVHAVRLYLSTCAEGSYNTRFLGMVRLKPEQLVEKIVAEIYGVAYELPEKLGMAAQFAPLRRAAYEAFSAAYPDEVGLLDSAIFGTAEA